MMKYINRKYYLARDEDGRLNLWTHLPVRCPDNNGHGEWIIDFDTFGENANKFISIIPIHDENKLFTGISWNTEPLEIVLADSQNYRDEIFKAMEISALRKEESLAIKTHEFLSKRNISSNIIEELLIKIFNIKNS